MSLTVPRSRLLDRQASLPLAGLLLLLGGLLAKFSVYWPGLSGPLLFDDMPVIGALLERGDLALGELLRLHLFSHSGPLGRPVTMLTFIANAQLNGSHLWAWKLTNVVIHALNGVLVYGIALRLFERQATARQAPLYACVVALAWLLHPLHVSSVLYTVQRMAQLAALFQLLGLLLYIDGRQALDAGRSRRAGAALLGALACLPLAVLAKENGILLVLFLPLVELLFLATAPGAPAARRARRWLAALGVACALLLVLFFVSRPGLLSDGAFVTRPFSQAERLLTELRVMVRYVGMTLLPLPSSMGFFHDGLPLSHGWLAPPTTLLSALFLLLLAAGAARLYRRLPLFTFGIGLFFCGHLLESTLIPLELMFEHRQYLPSVGLLLASVALLAALPLPRRVHLAGAVTALALLTLLTAGRAHAWGEEWRMFAQMLKARPESPTLNVIVANQLAEQLGQYARARAMLARFPGPASDLNLRFLDCVEHGRLEPGALQRIGTPEVVGYYESAGLINVGLAGLDERCSVPFAEYSDLITRWLARPLHANPAPLYIYLAHYRYRAGRLEPALQALEQAFRARRSSPVPLYLASQWLIDAGQLARAEEYLQRGSAVDRRHQERHRELAADVAARLHTARTDPAALQPFDPRK
jgi:hypothetical protein